MGLRLLDLFCGAGGAGMGYHRAGFEVVGVDINPQPRYPFEFHQADALEYLAVHGSEFDVIHASPPCQRWSWETPLEHREKSLDFIAPVRELLLSVGRPYVIENVSGARAQLRAPVMLCGSMFGLRVFRHRYFEIWPRVLLLTPSCRHDFEPVYVTGSTGWSGCGFRRVDATIAEKRAAMGIDWMVTAEIDQAVPPAYTEFIGRAVVTFAREEAGAWA